MLISCISNSFGTFAPINDFQPSGEHTYKGIGDHYRPGNPKAFFRQFKDIIAEESRNNTLDKSIQTFIYLGGRGDTPDLRVTPDSYVLVCFLDDVKSLESIAVFADGDKSSSCTLLVGLYAEKKDIKVSNAEITELAAHMGVPYFETGSLREAKTFFEKHCAKTTKK
mmetsp:Transcript_7013/g.7700  ORF Transcript_7013/g.7700 Transcript_7013/m.7700 type:complete len:167 (+) Transcript_7013:88-588(+)